MKSRHGELLFYEETKNHASEDAPAVFYVEATGRVVAQVYYCPFQDIHLFRLLCEGTGCDYFTRDAAIKEAKTHLGVQDEKDPD